MTTADMAFDIKGKVGMITGAASGIGLCCAQRLLKNGAKGVTVVDISNECGQRAVRGLQDKFGSDKAIFVQADVSDMHQLEDAFKKTVEQFKNLDILINNAAICNDAQWEKEIAVNVNGVAHGMLLGYETYIPKYRSGPESVIVNIACMCGIRPGCNFPVYTGTKHAVVGMSRAWGDIFHYNRTKIKVLTLCPSATMTPIMNEIAGKNLGPHYVESLQETLDEITVQTPESVASGIVKIIRNAETATVWIAQGGRNPYEVIFPEIVY